MSVRRCLIRTLLGLCVGITQGCVITSPSWDYVPESTTAPIPFQAWTTSKEGSVQLECATDSTAHGDPADGDASYIHVADLKIAEDGRVDSTGYVVYAAGATGALPAECWKFFGDYGYWQANVRVSQVIDGTKRYFSSFDAAGIDCLIHENGLAGSWFGFMDKCEKRFSNRADKIPYVVLRISG